MKELWNETISQIWVSPGGEEVAFFHGCRDRDEKDDSCWSVYEAAGDCCSTSFIEKIENGLRPDMNSVSLISISRGPIYVTADETVKSHAVSIGADGRLCKILLVNYSNGYYDGELKFRGHTATHRCTVLVKARTTWLKGEKK